MTAEEFYNHEFNHGLSPHFSKTTYIGKMHPKAYVEKETAFQFAEAYHYVMSKELKDRNDKIEKRYKSLKDKNADKGRKIKELQKKIKKLEAVKPSLRIVIPDER
jgi:chaperonin cofactor prefoldin